MTRPSINRLEAPAIQNLLQANIIEEWQVNSLSNLDFKYLCDASVNAFLIDQDFSLVDYITQKLGLNNPGKPKLTPVLFANLNLPVIRMVVEQEDFSLISVCEKDFISQDFKTALNPTNYNFITDLGLEQKKIVDDKECYSCFLSANDLKILSSVLANSHIIQYFPELFHNLVQYSEYFSTASLKNRIEKIEQTAEQYILALIQLYREKGHAGIQLLSLFLSRFNWSLLAMQPFFLSAYERVEDNDDGIALGEQGITWGRKSPSLFTVIDAVHMAFELAENQAWVLERANYFSPQLIELWLNKHHYQVLIAAGLTPTDIINLTEIQLRNLSHPMILWCVVQRILTLEQAKDLEYYQYYLLANADFNEDYAHSILSIPNLSAAVEEYGLLVFPPKISNLINLGALSASAFLKLPTYLRKAFENAELFVMFAVWTENLTVSLYTFPGLAWNNVFVNSQHHQPAKCQANAELLIYDEIIKFSETQLQNILSPIIKILLFQERLTLQQVLDIKPQQRELFEDISSILTIDKLIEEAKVLSHDHSKKPLNFSEKFNLFSQLWINRITCHPATLPIVTPSKPTP